MSYNLYWMPVVDPDYKSLPDALKFKFRDLFGYPVDRELDNAAIPQLRALEVCKVEGAKELIELIEKHGSVRVWEAE